jgi:hypothetical protein
VTCDNTGKLLAVKLRAGHAGAGWPTGMRVIVRRERPHPGA